MKKSFTPAAGFGALTPLYDLGIAALTRESRWRTALVKQIGVTDRDVVVDVGCGTGSLLVRLAGVAPGATLIGIDPDPAILARAREKARRAGARIEFHQGFAADTQSIVRGRATKCVSSLVFHQVPAAEKLPGLRAMVGALDAGSGEVHIADYGLQRSKAMRSLFRLTVQQLDGVDQTQPNADGILPGLMGQAGLIEVTETATIATPTGSISLYRGRRPR